MNPLFAVITSTNCEIWYSN